MITQEPKFTFASLIAAVGGNTGLFLGYSLLSMIELMEFLVISWVAWVTCCPKFFTANRQRKIFPAVLSSSLSPRILPKLSLPIPKFGFVPNTSEEMV